MSGSQREIALLTNPTAGGGRGVTVRPVARQRLREAGFAVRDLVGRDAEEALDLARRAVADGVEALVVVGGDGMAHLAIQAVAGTPVALGVVPAGSGNDLARYLDLPRADAAAAVDRVVGSRTRSIDLATSGARHFVTVLAAGFDARVNERANAMRWPRGRLRYPLATLAELGRLQPVRYTLELDGTTRSLEAVLVAVGNGPSFGGGLRITDGAVIDDGYLDVVLFKPVGRAGVLRTYPKLRTGAHTRHPQYEHHRVRQVTVAAAGITAYADGERFGRLPLTITCSPRALRVLA